MAKHARTYDQDEDKVMVVRNDVLFGERGREFYGFKYADSPGRDYEKVALENAQFVDITKNGEEENPEFQQIVAWGILFNPARRQAFVYKRADDYRDSRLAGQWSFGLGGHVRMGDVDGEDTFRHTLSRDIGGGRVELSVASPGIGLPEKTHKATYRFVSHLGYISIPWEVNSFHFGLVYLVETDATNAVPRGKEFSQGRMVNIREIIELGAKKDEKVDDWSSSCWPLMMKLLFSS